MVGMMIGTMTAGMAMIDMVPSLCVISERKAAKGRRQREGEGCVEDKRAGVSIWLVLSGHLSGCAVS